MQTIKYNQPHIHPIFDEFDRVYSLLSEHKEKKSLVPTVLDTLFRDLYDTFVLYADHHGNVAYSTKTYPKLEFERHKENIIVLFSGGKDSIATVKYYMNKGFNVYLYHMRHINSALSDEYLIAQDIADYLKIPLYVDTIKLSGHHEYVEHPMKNFMIANGALEWGIRENIGVKLAIGNYKASTWYYDNFEFCGGDDMEMWDIYNDIIGKFIPKFYMGVVLKDVSDSLKYVCADKPLLDLSVSCLGRANLRQYWHDWVLQKYDIMLPKHRCGRCYKCCVEYIYMTDHDLQDYNESYYIYCFNNLKRNLEREDETKYYINEVWEHYMPYSIKKSKFFKGDIDPFKYTFIWE